ncbi:TetR/AcrR family transcriptional regulator [Candidatus Colwellia aromaticivorans]|uniref:TetR/AcrR family transcriptional regulator n=1 Tax=Candidatus Colwellia aromaticivorans TaxID=2267621 RepID=UPI000DF2F291|nr:TetR/AcrR family transcriptional regulator [Candidatus Colwellia aromaticivorans]
MKNSALAKGRPVNPDKQAMQKAKLLASAEQLLAEKSFANITIRELAQHSGVNSAMISYYFTNKEGLFVALLDEMSTKHFTVMQAITQSADPIKTFIETILSMLNNNHGLARLIHHEFLSGNSAGNSSGSSTLSDIFIDRFPKKMASFIPQLVKNNTSIKDGRKAKYAAFSLVTMLITPFIHKSIRQQAWQISDEELQSPLWAEHIHQQFMFGCNSPSITQPEVLHSTGVQSKENLS